MIDWIVEPLSYGFMQRGLVTALIVGVVCSVLGCYIVLRSMAFLGDALAHAILPGVAIAYLLRGNLLLGALIAAVVVALGIGAVSRRAAVKEDTAIGILFSAALALGVALISTIQTYAVDLTHILFGNLLGVSNQDIVIQAVLAATVLLAIGLLYKDLLLISFDPILAHTLRLPVQGLQNLLLVLLALTIVVSLQAVGVGLVAAMLVTPAATAYLLTKRLPSMMLLAAAIGASSSFLGLFLSYYVNIVSGAAIVLIATGIFFVAFLIAPRRGLLSTRLWHHPVTAADTPAPASARDHEQG
ncbi:MAG: metal ABC transporter permease [Anaerolineae bacterium]